MTQMDKTELTQPSGRNGPSSEATLIEQQRAVAQVQGALVVAQQKPRDTIAARHRMTEACSLRILADHAFFRYSRGGGQITGPSIHLATELARCWGNIDYGISELRRDQDKGESEMLAYAWDLETNARVSTAFIVPHKRDKRGGPEPLVDMRDVYENNANQGARRLRECIFRVLPKAFVEEAKGICMATLEKGDGEPIEQQRERMLEAFADMGVSRNQVETKIGRAADRLSAFDLGTLRVIYQSLKRGEVTVAEEFPADEGAEVAQQLTGKTDAAEKAGPSSSGPSGSAHHPQAQAASTPEAGEGGGPAAPPASGPDQNGGAGSSGHTPAPPSEGAGEASPAEPAPSPRTGGFQWVFRSPRADEPTPCADVTEWAERVKTYLRIRPQDAPDLPQLNGECWDKCAIEYGDVFAGVDAAMEAAKKAAKETVEGEGDPGGGDQPSMKV